MSTEEITPTHIFTSGVTVANVGLKASGTECAEGEFDDETWKYLIRRRCVITLEEHAALADAAPAAPAAGTQPPVASNEPTIKESETLFDKETGPTVPLVDQVKAVLQQATKLQKAGIAEALEVSVEKVEPLLTPENGIQQAGGWYSLTAS